MATPRWDDVNKLLEQNMKMRLWIEEQREYIKALIRAVPPSLIEDLQLSLPSFPDVPESLDICEPRRMLNSPIDDSRISFPSKPELPPRGSSKTAMKLMRHSFPLNVTTTYSPPTPIEEVEMLYLAYASLNDNQKNENVRH